jgi:hypothetical protein
MMRMGALAAAKPMPKSGRATRVMPAQQMRGAVGAASLSTRRTRAVERKAARVVCETAAEDEVEMLEKALAAAKVSLAATISLRIRRVSCPGLRRRPATIC